jgi:hypothetical protein
MHYKYPLILILSAFAAGWGVWYTVHAATPVVKSPATPPPVTQSVQPGPWGQLDCSPIYLEAPDSLLASVPKPNTIPRWIFPGADGAYLRALFAKAGLPDAMQQRLLDPQRWTSQEGAICLFPLVDDLIAMTPEMREIIYPELAKTPENEFHHDPIYIFGGLDDWLRDADLSAESQALIRKMTYRKGRALAFSDIRTLLHTARTEAEVQHIFKTATRTRTLVATLRIPPDSDPKALADYWTGGRPDSDILPLLASVSERSSGTMLDITHLVPPLARRRLYTYPTPELAVRGRLPDCHWTSLNFFSNTRQDYFLDTRLASRRVIENYTTVQPPYRFGDVLFFNTPTGDTIHSCVYIAADIVFTKNGENALSPWILMRLGDVQDLYLQNAQYTMQGYREKIGPQTASF